MADTSSVLSALGVSGVMNRSFPSGPWANTCEVSARSVVAPTGPWPFGRVEELASLPTCQSCVKIVPPALNLGFRVMARCACVAMAGLVDIAWLCDDKTGACALAVILGHQRIGE